jgi:diaminohydroxyphosphoribosylaminopyrimidine deaminase/5-amino-6-(5-phosphoribosylamino)uracil reductase
MTLALSLAAKGIGLTNPNPAVGAVLVADGRVVGLGYHRRAGGPHAEIYAIKAAGEKAAGATLYVTLEPCSHLNKRTPPCAHAVIRSKIRRVVVAMLDPNPAVEGRGVALLRHAGIDVLVGLGRSEAEALNEAYCYRMRTGRPFVILKAGMTLDGKIATVTGLSRWITGLPARRHVHQVRRETDAIVVGLGTVLRDDPSLTARLSDRPLRLAPRQPLRVILDSRLRVPVTAEVVRTASRIPTLVATTASAPRPKRAALTAKQVEVVMLPARNGKVSLRAFVSYLARRSVNSLLVEGGSEVNAAFLAEGLVNKVMLYTAPILMGGCEAKGLIGGRGPSTLRGVASLERVTVTPLGRDFLVQGYLARP